MSSDARRMALAAVSTVEQHITPECSITAVGSFESARWLQRSKYFVYIHFWGGHWILVLVGLLKLLRADFFRGLRALMVVARSKMALRRQIFQTFQEKNKAYILPLFLRSTPESGRDLLAEPTREKTAAPS